MKDTSLSSEEWGWWVVSIEHSNVIVTSFYTIEEKRTKDTSDSKYLEVLAFGVDPWWFCTYRYPYYSRSLRWYRSIYRCIMNIWGRNHDRRNRVPRDERLRGLLLKIHWKDPSRELGNRTAKSCIKRHRTSWSTMLWKGRKLELARQIEWDEADHRGIGGWRDPHSCSFHSESIQLEYPKKCILLESRRIRRRWLENTSFEWRKTSNAVFHPWGSERIELMRLIDCS